MEKRGVTRKEQYEIAKLVAGNPAFWNSLDEIERAVVNVHLFGQGNEEHHIPLLAEEGFPAIHLRYENEMMKTNRVSMHRYEPELASISADRFQLIYPDGIRVDLNRQFNQQLNIVVWENKRNENALAAHVIDLPGKATFKDQRFLKILQECLAPEYTNIHFYEGYNPENPEDATFIVAGPWTITKGIAATVAEYILEGEVISYGDRETAPCADPVEVGRFKTPIAIAERILTEDAKLSIENKLQHIQDRQGLFS